MEAAEPGDEVDVERLEDYLRVLGYASRLELLTLLSRPRTLDEIDLKPKGAQAEDNPDRTISRQAVQHHLDRLIEVGLVRPGRTTDEDDRSRNTYRTDHARLFAVLEELRRLCRRTESGEVEPFRTSRLPDDVDPPGSAWDGPRLVLVHGVEEGRTFPLRPGDLDEPRGWVIGRDPDVHVPIPYDPYVSQENAEVVRDEDGGYRIMDLRTAKNGTAVNWERLPVGGQHRLTSGDVVRVGRSLLVFKEP